MEKLSNDDYSLYPGYSNEGHYCLIVYSEVILNVLLLFYDRSFMAAMRNFDGVDRKNGYNEIRKLFFD